MHEYYTCADFFFFGQVYTRVVYFVLSYSSFDIESALTCTDISKYSCTVPS